MTIHVPITTEPDFDRDIHVALRPAPVHDPYHEANHLQERGTSGANGFIGYYFVAAFVVIFIAVPVANITPFAILLAGVLLIGAWIHYLVRARRNRALADTLNLPTHSDIRFRLRVVGSPDRVYALSPLLATPVAQFEPFVFRAARAHQGPGRTLIKHAIVAAILIFCLVAGTVLSALYLGSTTRAASHVLTWCMVLSSPVVCALLWTHLWPTYIRVVPGRLDILQYPVLGRGKPRTRSINLRTARILVRIPRRALVVLPNDVRGEWICTSATRWGAHLDFEAAILNAARSDEPSPPLPDGELIG